MRPKTPAPASGPPPPRLHWSIVLLLSIVTIGLFLDIWLIVQAVWVRQHHPQSRALTLYIISVVLSIVAEIFNALHLATSLTAGVFIVSLVLALIATFAVRDALAVYIARRTGKPAYLGGFLTLILGPIYLQYHMNKVK